MGVPYRVHNILCARSINIGNIRTRFHFIYTGHFTNRPDQACIVASKHTGDIETPRTTKRTHQKKKRVLTPVFSSTGEELSIALDLWVWQSLYAEEQ